MENLPDHLLVEIFDRLPYATDLASCRLVSKRLCSASYNVHSISVRCSRRRLLLQRHDPTAIVPFKSLLKNLVTLFDQRCLHSLSVKFERSFDSADGDGSVFDERDDFWITNQEFVASLLGGELGSRLTSLVLKDFWPQSFQRRSKMLQLLSTHCKNLQNLELKSANLRVRILKPMLMLRRLSFVLVRLDDEGLDKINECFPFLEVLKLFLVVGLNNPKIQMQTLKTCNWVVSDVSSFTICAPMLTKLRLSCVKPKHVILRTPQLHCLELVVEKHIESIEVGQFHCLEFMELRTPVLGNILQVFTGCSVGRLDVDRGRKVESTASEDLISSFPAAATLKLGPGILSKLQRSLIHGCLSFESLSGSLTTLILRLSEPAFEFSGIYDMIPACPLVKVVVLIFPSDTPRVVSRDFTSTFAKMFPRIKWRRQ